MTDVSVHGFADDRFAEVREMLAGSLATGEDLGASFCATIEGETVVDLWGGYADAARTKPWKTDTIVNVYSTTKTMTALTALLVADRGLIDFDAPVAKYWPEFAANGKAGVKVSHLMSHSAGLPDWDEQITKETLYNWDEAVSLLAAQAPRWPPGAAPGYHSVTQGYLVGEVVRRVTGKSLGTVFREEIAEPLGADFHIGLPASEDARVAELVPPETGPADTTAPSAIAVDVSLTKTRAWRNAGIPAVGGTGNARAVAEIHAILANAGIVKGKRFLSEAGCRKALELQVEGNDSVLGQPMRFGMGFALAGNDFPSPGPNTIYWGGYGGSIAIIDMDSRATFAYVMNRMVGSSDGDLRGFMLADAMWRALKPTR